MHNEATHIAHNKDRKSRVQAGVAGASGGTVFMLIAESLPENWVIKPVLVYLSPSFSVISSAFWLWTLKMSRQHQRNKKLAHVLKQLQGYVNNPMTSKTHKARLIKKMEEIEISVLSRKMKEVEDMFNREP